MQTKTFSFTAVGDMLIQRRLPDTYEGLEELVRFIEQGDLRYFNLETTLNRGESWGNQYGGGSWLRADPKVLEDIKRMGFNMASIANNHSLDFSHWGLIKTFEAFEAFGMPYAGAGRNLTAAAQPAYLDTSKGRIALIATCSTFEPASMAGEQSRRFMGRPGLNGLHFHETFVLPSEEMEILKKIAAKIHINAYDDIWRKEGYLPQIEKGRFKFGKYDFQEGEAIRRLSTVDETDMQRIIKNIKEAEFQADFVAVAIHSHELAGDAKETPDDFLIEFAHRCIDAGADTVIGAGPHLLRPIEIYKGCPIFYSLGDFILENENIPYGPEDFYKSYDLTSDNTMLDLFKKRSQNFTKGLQTDRRAFETVVPHCQYEDGKLKKITLLPVELGFGSARSMGGLPRIQRHASFIRRLIEMSEPFGTRICETEDGLAEIII